MPTQLLIASRTTSLQYFTKTESRVFAIAFISLLLRNMLMEHWDYLFLLWNLFLAFVPILIQQLSLKLATVGSKFWYTILMVWLLFLPNAPYIVTDLMHPIVAYKQGLAFGLPLGLLSVCFTALLGMLWFSRSLRHFDEQLHQLGWDERSRRFAIALVILATACGVWMGRVLRFNTWDVLTKPWQVMSDSAHFISTPIYAEWILVTAIILWGTWRAYERWSWVGEVVE